MVLVDEARGKLYCANVGDCAAMLVHIPSATAAAPSLASTASSIGGGDDAKDSNSPPRVPTAAAPAAAGNEAMAVAASSRAAANSPSPPPPEAMLTEELANANISSPGSNDEKPLSSASPHSTSNADADAAAAAAALGSATLLPLPAPFVAMNRYDGAEDYSASVAGFDGGNGMYAGGAMFQGRSGNGSAYHNVRSSFRFIH